jgi:hypothetical protein
MIQASALGGLRLTLVRPVPYRPRLLLVAAVNSLFCRFRVVGLPTGCRAL